MGEAFGAQRFPQQLRADVRAKVGLRAGAGRGAAVVRRAPRLISNSFPVGRVADRHSAGGRRPASRCVVADQIRFGVASQFCGAGVAEGNGGDRRCVGPRAHPRVAHEASRRQ